MNGEQPEATHISDVTGWNEEISDGPADDRVIANPNYFRLDGTCEWPCD
jgi:hypothetical protein